MSLHVFDLNFSQNAPDIQLNVKGIKNLYDSFKDYVAVEMLDGEKQHQTEIFGLQDAKKGIMFESFPPVLHLQLKRFEYDTQRDAMVEIDERHEFPFEIDLDEFLDASADRSQPWIYKLHGVLVYSGDQYGGHYFALIKPDLETRWLKFDDARVTPVTDKEVLEENYGGKAPNGMPPTLQCNAVHVMKCFTLASKLVYIRESAIDEVLAPCTVDDMPTHLSMWFISCFRGGHDMVTYLWAYRNVKGTCDHLRVAWSQVIASDQPCTQVRRSHMPISSNLRSYEGYLADHKHCSMFQRASALYRQITRRHLFTIIWSATQENKH